jgi:hypothetical protein
MSNQQPYDIRIIVAQANLLAQGLMIQESDGLMITVKGAARAFKVFDTLQLEDRLLILGLVKGMVYKEINNE